MLHELVIYKKTQDFLKWLYPTISRLPRSEKYTLGKRMEDTVVEIIEGIVSANYEIDKINTLGRLRVRMEILQFEIRLLKDIGVFTTRQYGFASKSLNELKRILFGWMKSSKNVPVKQDGHAFGNYYFGMDYEAGVETEELPHTEENLQGALKDLNEKIDVGKKKNFRKSGGSYDSHRRRRTQRDGAESDDRAQSPGGAQGRWLFHDDEPAGGSPRGEEPDDGGK